MRYLALALVAVFPGLVHAQYSQGPIASATGVGEWQIRFASDGTPLASRTVTSAPGGFSVGDKLSLSTPKGAAFEVATSRFMSSAAARAAIKVAAGVGWAGLAVGVAATMYEILKPAGIGKGDDGSPVVDPGQPKQTLATFSGPDGIYRTEGATLAKRVDWQLMICRGTPNRTCSVASSFSRAHTGQGVPVGSVWFDVVVNQYGSDGKLVAQLKDQSWSSPRYEPACPDVSTYLTPVDPALCPSNVRRAPTDAEWDAALNRVSVENIRDLARRSAEAATKAGKPPLTEAPTYAPPSPATVSDKPITTTRPDGSTETKTPSWDIEITPDGKVKLSPRTVVTTTDSTGAPSGTTVTVGGAGQEGEFYTDCDKFPDSVGCMKPGEASDVPLPEQSVDIGAAPAAGWGDSSSSCPAPRTVEVMGTSLQVDNTILCDFFGGIRFAVIGAFGLAAALIFVGGLKQ